jgi:hypothetical protein
MHVITENTWANHRQSIPQACGNRRWHTGEIHYIRRSKTILAEWKSDRHRVYLCATALRKRACHYLRDAAASFLATHRSTAQISHNAIANPTIDRSKPMIFQKDHAPPGI